MIMKKIKKILWIVVIFGIGLFFLFRFKAGKETKGKDLKIGVITEKGLEIISISEERKIINILKIGNQVQLWIPGGLGWYRNDRIKRILDQENKRQTVSDIFFYNLGFIPDKAYFLNGEDDWKKISVLGLKNWIRFKVFETNFIINEEQIGGDFINKSDPFLNNIMARDFADTKIVNDETRLTVINATSELGLADFIANRLTWAGFSVVSLDNSTDETKRCLIKSGSKIKENYSITVLNKLLGCELREDVDLDEYETELYLGENLVQMLKYSNYK